MKKAALVGVTALLLVVPACGASSKDATTTAGKEVVTSMTSSIAKDGGLLTKKSATCVAKDFVNRVGVKELRSAKVVGADGSYNDNGANVNAKVSASYASALLGSVPEKTALASFQQSMQTAYGASTAGVLSGANVQCLVGTFVKKAGVKRLLSNKVITDAGVFNTTGPKYDTRTATDLADAIVGCVDYLKAEAAGAASADKKIDAAALETCLKSKITEAEIRDSVVATITNSSGAEKLVNSINTRAAACEKTAKK
ncbi:MAG: hypothetical protein ACJ72D_21595 [Marmoricola sp.]